MKFDSNIQDICVCIYIYVHSRERDTGWRRPIGCLKLQVIFRKRATNYSALLRKMTYEDKASYESTPPCMYIFDKSTYQRGKFTRIFVSNFIIMTWLIHICDMAHSCVWHDLFMCVTWLFPTLFICVTYKPCHTYEWVMSHTHMNESCHTYEWVMSHIEMALSYVIYMCV